ncbi:MAG: hypothetical protein HY865_22570 [Chloroflexi bacterium]|nr:hypothetical protein [Chloroflexota bacterium]
MNDVSAVPAGSVFESFQKLVEKPVIKKEITKQSKIASLSSSDGFKALQEVIDQYIEGLRNLPVDPNKDSVESIGFRYLASQVTIEYLKDLRDMPRRYAELQNSTE